MKFSKIFVVLFCFIMIQLVYSSPVDPERGVVHERYPANDDARHWDYPV